MSESTTPHVTVKSTYSLIYANGKLNNLQNIDTIRENGSPMKSPPLFNNILTGDESKGYKLISDIYWGNAVYKMEYASRKIANGYEVVTVENDILGYKSSYTYSQFEPNLNDQIINNGITKFANIDKNDVKLESPFETYYRYEYDNKGNVIKVFIKNVFSPSEILSSEYTYDDKPNPYKVLKWVYRLFGFRDLAIYESTNNILTSKNYLQGVLASETIEVYTYNNQTGYPLTKITTEKLFNSTFKLKTTKTAFKY